MEHKDTKNNLFLLTIVGIVAIVAIIIMIVSTGSRTYNLSEDTAGAASRATASADLSTEGKSVTDTTTTEAISITTCTDTDGGKNYTVKGTTKAGTTTKTDFCTNYNGTLVEYYCNRNKIASISPLPSECPYGCENGACRTQPVAVCGNGVIDPGEQCDGGTGGITCTDFGNFIGGTLRCYPPGSSQECKFDTSGCYDALGDAQLLNLTQVNTTVRALFNVDIFMYPPNETVGPPPQYRGFYEILTATQEQGQPGIYYAAWSRFYPNDTYPQSKLVNIVTSPILYTCKTYTTSIYFQESPWGSYPYNRFLVKSITFNTPCNGYCGDGVIQAGEQCDGSNLGGMLCTDFGSFTGGTLGCRSDCTFDTSNCDAGTGYCGDNLINNFPNEQCDGTDWGNINSCADLGFTGGLLSCNTPFEENRCNFDTSNCTGITYGVCGDGIINPGEQCEINRPLTATCLDFGYMGGTLTCDYSTCMYDVSQCIMNVTPYCGDGIRNGNELCDGNDLGGITCTDIGSFTGGTLTCYAPGSSQQCTFNTANCTTGTVSRRFSTNSVPPNTTVSVTLTKNFAYQQGTLLIEEYVPSSFVILSNGGGSVSGNTIRWALLSNITPGNYTYTVRTPTNPGTYSFSGLYSVNGGATQNILGSTQVTVLNQTTSTGNLYVSTNPTGASLYVDNIYKGTTPRTVTSLTVGNHNIRISKTGYYDYTTTRYIYAGQTTNLTVTLQQNVTQSCTDSDGGINYNVFGTLTFTNGSYTYNYTDYCSTGSTLYERYCSGSIPSISVYTCPYGCSGGKCINQTISVGNIEVETYPTGASLYVDNIYKGTTPRMVTNLTVGSHSVLLTKAGYYGYYTSSYVYAGQTTFLNVTLTQNVTGNWTQWFNRDGPGGSGDWEQKINFPTVCMNPLTIQCVTVSGEIPSTQTGQVTHCELNNGFWCVNAENNQTCLDYKVRWLCP